MKNVRHTGRRRPYGLVLLLGGLAGLLTSCGAPPASEPPSSQVGGVSVTCPVRVYLLRGLWDVFSVGFNSLADVLRRHGIPATATSGPDWRNLLDEIVATETSQSKRVPLVLVGHSYGSDDAVHLCEALQAVGIRVDLVISIDGTNPDPIPPNVDRCIHIYLPTSVGEEFPSVFAGNPVKAAQGNDHTIIENIILSESTFGPEVRGTDHFNIDSDRLVHERILNEVLGLCATDEAQQQSAADGTASDASDDASDGTGP